MSDATGSAVPDLGGVATLNDIVQAHETVDSAAYEWCLADDRLQWSASAAAFLGPDVNRELASGNGYAAIVTPGSGGGRAAAVEACLSAGLAGESKQFDIRYSIRLPGRDGARELHVIDRGVCHFDAGGRVERVLGLIKADTAGGQGRPAAPAAVQVLPNAGTGRRPLAMLVKDWLERAGRTGEPFGVILIEIDDLVRLNDTYGFDAVDEVIEIFRRRLRAELAEGEAMGRCSVGSFGLLLRLRPGEDFAARVHGIVDAVNAKPPSTERGVVAAGVTAGALTVPVQAGTLADVFRRVQDALYHARHRSRGSFAIFDPAIDRAAEQCANLQFADTIVRALDEERVGLAFQPVAAAATRRIAFHEALVRVRGRNGYVLDGAAVIPTAERFGLTGLIDRRTLQLAFATLAADPQLTLSVNVSPTNLDDGSWLRLMESHAGDGLCRRLIVEITESARLVDIGHVRRRIDWLHELGCRVAIDDFGVGYTSFRSLRELNVDILKIDGSFVSGLVRSEPDSHFVRALIELAAHLGVTTVAEWVLDEPTASRLVEWGCTYLQGELIGLAAPQPLPG
ncbi:diguanylate cyclase (GGDEF)-like protein [Ancylobacter sp. 3268]|uniref:GGDEF and EAL domain-containing protein n=1 Tax=Ancylobacter sp. 3268 TaxID=2817752 RepID=UPI00285D67B5|nr:GGDEF and EAL domain-containing protein [Ancylobacter sp. 3268]MDR6951957.1 diguanylate cyclase (GGDEF)-like protein [Ancylobacter sp. 3268]